MKDLLIINNAFKDCFTLCDKSQVKESIERARLPYENDKTTYERYLVEYPNMADEWQKQLAKTKKVLKQGFSAVTWEQFQLIQREKWLSKKAKKITRKEYYYAFEVLPPLHWVQDERCSMFFIGEPTYATFHQQYLWDKTTNKYYSAMADTQDRTTWIDRLLGI